jgi:uncharacterized membrane protein YfcA
VFPLNFALDPGLAEYLYLIVVMGFAGLVHGAIGLGFPMVATPLIAVFMDVRLAILLTLLPTVTVNVASIWSGSDNWKSLSDFRILFFCVLLGSIVGAWMLATLDPSPFRLALALLILLYLWVTLSGRLSNSWASRENMVLMVGIGLIAGLSGGVTNVMVAILIIYLLGMNMGKAEMVPVLNTCFLMGKLSQIAVLSLAGMVNMELVMRTVPLAVAALAALLAGQKIGKSISVAFYRKLLYVLLSALALILIIQFALDPGG